MVELFCICSSGSSSILLYSEAVVVCFVCNVIV